MKRNGCGDCGVGRGYDNEQTCRRHWHGYSWISFYRVWRREFLYCQPKGSENRLVGDIVKVGDACDGRERRRPWRVMVPKRNLVERRWCMWRMRSSEVRYEPRKCDWWGRAKARKEWCQIFQNWCLGGRGGFGGLWCQTLHWDRGKWRWWICQSQRRREYCLKCEEWMFRCNGGGDML